ncbi:hypothetical protein E2C01_009560 [Portunus trituberculatus]|uniref:Uncharacterized protein n=1 Tax=Portunus trituberculatus TaxID=210409 RepID=A0A5B7D6B9_PORTR|nr:hypothetical protein [Portunus trituberculatus]
MCYNDTVSYTCLTLSYELKLIFEKWEIVLLRAGAGSGFARHDRSSVEAGGGTAECGLPGCQLGREWCRLSDAQGSVGLHFRLAGRRRI